MKIGDVVSHYRIVEPLGAGGMGVVYKAEDTRLKRVVALKFLSMALVQDRDARERLLQEARAASALDHPNICTIHEIEETADGHVFLAMAYYDGETLKDRLARAPLTIDEAVDFLTQIARGVAAAHEGGIVHRDIKPANIAITRRGEIKLLDFGLAKAEGQTALTRTGTTVGTVAYMAPEHLAGKAVDERADVWALGVVGFEMIAGRRPFIGEHEVAVLRAIADGDAPPLRSLRPDVPAAIAAIIDKALQKDPERRQRNARALLHDLESLRAANDATQRIATPRTTSPRLKLAVAAALAAVAIAGSWFGVRALRIRRARLGLPAIADLIRHEQNTTAFHRIRELEPTLANDQAFTDLKKSFLIATPFNTEPQGADIYVRGYRDEDLPWIYLGKTPIEIPMPLGQFRIRATKAGFADFEGTAGTGGSGGGPIALKPAGSVPAGMVAVPGGTVQLPGRTVTLQDFYIDRFEVTNREFKQFIDAGGYGKPEFWQEPFVKNGRTIDRDEAMQELRDATGRPGPATWELGHYPEGQDNYPVSGVSWYEAAAYARFAGKRLPTVHHWRRAAIAPGSAIFSEILSLSNFGGKGAAPVGQFHGIASYGAYDMAGNVKEWCWNSVDERRYILGGAWNEPSYQFSSADALAPFDRRAGNGFRLMKAAGDGEIAEAALRPVETFARNYSAEKPVSDDAFKIFKASYDYDRADLKAKVESTDSDSPFWRVERVSYAAAYGNERIIAHLFLPKNAKPPYQTVIYFPSSGALVFRSFEIAELSYLGFAVKSGRALLLPMYKGTYERRIGAIAGPNALRDVTIQRIKDVRRSIDYLDSRPDIDRSKIAYFGVSFGAGLAPLALAVEDRLKTAVLWSGGFPPLERLPEIDPLNFAPRVTIPVLMLNGRDDFTFPIETSQVPMFQSFGTPAAEKRHVLFDGGHVFPFARVEKDTLEWLDKYFGVPK